MIKTAVRRGFKFVHMWKNEYVQWAVMKYEIDEEAAIARWRNKEQATSDEEKDWGGPAHAPLELPICIEKYTLGETDEALEKQTILQSK